MVVWVTGVDGMSELNAIDGRPERVTTGIRLTRLPFPFPLGLVPGEIKLSSLSPSTTRLVRIAEMEDVRGETLILEDEAVYNTCLCERVGLS
jgi:hypothetical protein